MILVLYGCHVLWIEQPANITNSRIADLDAILVLRLHQDASPSVGDLLSADCGPDGRYVVLSRIEKINTCCS